jgi:hypothetical protein
MTYRRPAEGRAAARFERALYAWQRGGRWTKEVQREPRWMRGPIQKLMRQQGVIQGRAVLSPLRNRKVRSLAIADSAIEARLPATRPAKRSGSLFCRYSKRSSLLAATLETERADAAVRL